MFIRYFVEIPRRADEVERHLLPVPSRWAAGAAAGAESTGERLLAEVGFGSSGLRMTKRVEMDFGEAVTFPSKTVLPMTWKAARLGRLFPRLDADIEVAPLGPARTQLSISARYAPPLGSVGRVLDRGLMHRIAEATVKDFLDRAALGLAEPAPDHARPLTETRGRKSLSTSSRPDRTGPYGPRDGVPTAGS